jgi:hypothetical protein
MCFCCLSLCVRWLFFEDFFMSPEHQIFFDVISGRPSLVHLIDSVQFLLLNQFVRCPVSGRVLNVVRGSGMGSQVSSDLSDLAFFDVVECHALHRMRDFGVRSYVRYRDDIFMVCESSIRAHGFLELLRAKAHGVWRIKVEGASKAALPFLDVLIQIGGDGTIAYRPWSKPSKLFLPLHEESSHQHKVHAWPLAEVRRLATNSSDNLVFQLALLDFIRKCIDAQLNGSIIARLFMEMDAWPMIHKLTKPKRRVHGIVVPFVLDYHPLFEEFGLLACVKHVFNLYSLELRNLVGEGTDCVVAYRSTASRLFSRLKKL